MGKVNDAQCDVCLHALCVGSGTTSLGVRDGLISDPGVNIVTSRRSARTRKSGLYNVHHLTNLDCCDQTVIHTSHISHTCIRLFSSQNILFNLDVPAFSERVIAPQF